MEEDLGHLGTQVDPDLVAFVRPFFFTSVLFLVYYTIHDEIGNPVTELERKKGLERLKPHTSTF